MNFNIYTWKDVERKVKLHFCKYKYDFINSVDVYNTEMII